MAGKGEKTEGSTHKSHTVALGHHTIMRHTLHVQVDDDGNEVWCNGAMCNGDGDRKGEDGTEHGGDEDDDGIEEVKQNEVLHGSMTIGLFCSVPNTMRKI